MVSFYFGNIKEFLDIISRYHPSIKFSRKYLRERINLLDVEISKEDNRMLTDIFDKSIVTYQLKKVHTVKSGSAL